MEKIDFKIAKGNDLASNLLNLPSSKSSSNDIKKDFKSFVNVKTRGNKFSYEKKESSLNKKNDSLKVEAKGKKLNDKDVNVKNQDDKFKDDNKNLKNEPSKKVDEFSKKDNNYNVKEDSSKVENDLKEDIKEEPNDEDILDLILKYLYGKLDALKELSDEIKKHSDGKLEFKDLEEISKKLGIDLSEILELNQNVQKDVFNFLEKLNDFYKLNSLSKEDSLKFQSDDESKNKILLEFKELLKEEPKLLNILKESLKENNFENKEVSVNFNNISKDLKELKLGENFNTSSNNEKNQDFLGDFVNNKAFNSEEVDSKDILNSEIKFSKFETFSLNSEKRIDNLRKDVFINNFKEIVDEVKMLKTLNKTSIDLKLSPEHLGNLRIKLSQEDGSLNAYFTVEKEETKKVLEGQLNILRENLESAGVLINNINVEVGQSNEELNKHKHMLEAINLSRKPRNIDSEGKEEFKDTLNPYIEDDLFSDLI